MGEQKFRCTAVQHWTIDEIDRSAATLSSSKSNHERLHFAADTPRGLAVIGSRQEVAKKTESVRMLKRKPNHGAGVSLRRKLDNLHELQHLFPRINGFLVHFEVEHPSSYCYGGGDVVVMWGWGGGDCL